MLAFDTNYYRRVIEEHGYSPLEFQEMTFDLPSIEAEVLALKWLCHTGGDAFAEGVRTGKRAIVTTGIGLSGAPHMGTLSQIIRAIFLQRAGLTVQFVLGDLDSYNARNQPLALLDERADQYREFIVALGFREESGILRRQMDRTDVLRTAYLVSNVLRDADFQDTVEDLVRHYHAGPASAPRYYPAMDFPVKQSILLMIADFLHLGMVDQFQHVQVMLGIEEHLYVRLAKLAASRLALPLHIGGLYSRIIRGFNNHPKMSKSIPGSGITVDMAPEAIRTRIMEDEGAYSTPHDSVVYQMMCAVSDYSGDELQRLFTACQTRSGEWNRQKARFAEELVERCRKWPK